MPIVGSLFAGIGGFDLGLGRAGFTMAWQVELDPFCRRVLAARWPGVDRSGDIRAFGMGRAQHGEAVRGDIAGRIEGGGPQRDQQPIDLFVGGFPCQDLSVAGKRAGLGGERSGLFWEIVRIAKAPRPTWGLFENVPGLVSSHRGRDMALVIKGLRECWPVVGWRILDSRYFGVAQRRRRVFFVCGPTEAGVAQVLALGEGGAGDLAAGGEAGADIAHAVAAGAGGSKFGSGRDGQDDNVVTALRHLGSGGHALTGEGHDASEDGTGRGTPLIAFDTTQITSKLNYSNPQPGDPCHPLAEGAHAPLLISGRDDASPSETDARTLLHRVRDAVGAEAFAEWGAGILDPLQPPSVLQSSLHGGELRSAADQVRAWLDDGPSSRAEDGAARPLYALWQAECLRRAPQEWRLAGQLAGELGAYLSRVSSPRALGRAQSQSSVRRLTPVEAERLQGFPDGWTCLCQPLEAYAQDPDSVALRCICPDSPRYRALGNAVTVNVVEWIGRRLMTAL